MCLQEIESCSLLIAKEESNIETVMLSKGSRLESELWGIDTCHRDSVFHCGTLASPSSFLLPTVTRAQKQREEKVKEPLRDKWKMGRWRGIRAFCFLDSLSYSRIHNACNGYIRVRELNRRKTTLHWLLLWLVTRVSAVFIPQTLRPPLNNSVYFAWQSNNRIRISVYY